MLYISKEGKFIRRGSPAGPAEAGVYAYTKVCNFLHLVGSFPQFNVRVSIACLLMHTHEHDQNGCNLKNT